MDRSEEEQAEAAFEIWLEEHQDVKEFVNKAHEDNKRREDNTKFLKEIIEETE